MVTYMNDQDVQTVDQIRAFLKGTEHVEFEVQGKEQRYAWTEHTLRRFHYHELARAERGLILRFIQRVSGLSRAQVTRLVRQYRRNARVRRHQRTVRPFTRRYTQADVRLLAALDELHGTLSAMDISLSDGRGGLTSSTASTSTPISTSTAPACSRPWRPMREANNEDAIATKI